MATRFYLHAATDSTSGLPTAEQSSLTSEGDFEGSQTTNRQMTTTIGSGQTSLARNTLAGDVLSHNYYCSRWVSPPIYQTSVSANTWTYNFAAAEQAAATNFPVSGNNAPVRVNCYVWRPSNQTKVGTILDGNTASTVDEATSGEVAHHVTFSGSAVSNVQNGDVIIFEAWFIVDPATGGNDDTMTFYYDGTTANTTDNASVSNHASFIETPENLVLVLMVAQTYTHKYNIKNLATGTYTHKWNIKNLVAKTFTHKYNIRSLANQIFTHKWNIRNLATGTFTHKWNIRGLVTQTYTHIYNILESVTAVSNTFTHVYNIRNLANQTFTHKWNIRNIVNQTYTHIWNIKNLVANTFTHIHNIKNLIANTFTHFHNIRNLVTGTYTHIHNIRNLAASTFTHKYHIRNLVAQTYTHFYNILEIGATLVSNTFTHKYNIRNLAGQTYTHKWNIRNLIANTFTHFYGIKNLVSNTFTHFHNIRNLTTGTFTHRYNIKNLVSQTYTHFYNILGLILVSNTFTHVYNIKNLATGTYIHRWNIWNSVNQIFTHRYNITKSVAQLFTHRYNITMLASQTFSHKYNIINLVGRTFTHIYNILTRGFNDPHIMMLNLLKNNWPNDGSVIPRKSEILFGEWPNNQADFLIVTEESPTTTDVSDDLDISQNVYGNVSKVKVHVYVKSFNILSPSAAFKPQSDPEELYQMVSFIQNYIDTHPADLQPLDIYEMEQKGAEWEPRGSWRDDMFHAIVNVELRYVD